MKRLLALMMLLSLCPQAWAEGLASAWQGARWGISQEAAVAIWKGRGWRYKVTLDSGTVMLAGKYAGYNASLFVDPGTMTDVFIAIDSQQNKTSAQIWVDLRELLRQKYGDSTGLHWRRSGTDDSWQEVDTETDDTEAMSRAFYSADSDVSTQWTEGPIYLQLFTGKLDNGNRCVFVLYRHTQGTLRKKQQQERSRLEAV